MSSAGAANLPPQQQAENDDTLIPSLPVDIAINILARVPRSQHPILSLVSKPFKSLLSSPLFFSTRRRVGATEHCLYLILRCQSNPSLLSFTLHCNPPEHRRFIPIAQIPSPHSVESAYAAIGTDLFALGGSVNDAGSSRVSILDCRVNTWRPGPAMRICRGSPAAAAIDGKLYVIGGCEPDSWARAAYWAEVLDPAGNGPWARVPSPTDVIKEMWMHAAVAMDGKMYVMAGNGGLVFDPLTGEWVSVGGELDQGWTGRGCVVNGVLYCYDHLGKIKWFDGRASIWKELQGVEHELPIFMCGLKMADMGGNLVLVWEEGPMGQGKEMQIIGAEIEVRKDSNGDLIGAIQWSDSLLKVPDGSCIMKCLVVAW